MVEECWGEGYSFQNIQHNFTIYHMDTFLPPSLSLYPPPLSTIEADYMGPMPEQLTFSSMASSRQCFTVTIIDDNIFERLETFSVGLSSSDPNVRLVGPGGVSAMQITAAVDIIDNDGKTTSNTGIFWLYCTTSYIARVFIQSWILSYHNCAQQ